MRTISGSIGAAAFAQAALPRLYQAETLREAERAAAMAGWSAEQWVELAETAERRTALQWFECALYGHNRRSWHVLGNPADQRDVCIRCGERL